MNKFLLIACALFFPAVTFAAPPATFLASEAPLATTSAPGNSYIGGSSVVVTAPTMGDLVVAGGSVVSAGSVAQDATFVGGTVSVRAPISGDLRTAGGNITIDEAVAGDVIIAGYRVDNNARAGGSVFIAGANVSMTSGAVGPVIVYANNVYLDGEFSGEVKVVAGGAVTLGSSAVIKGKFSYESPEPARVAETAVLKGPVEYTSASYLPDASASRSLAVVSVAVFLLVRILGALILAGLLAGLFPRLAEAVVLRATTRRTRSVLLTALLGFAAIVATPILLVLLALTFVGIGLAVLLTIAYALLVFLAFMYAGILLGALFVRRFLGRDTILWHDGVLGMLALSLVALLPIIGWIIVLGLTAFCAGVLLSLFFSAAFPGDSEEDDL